MKLEELLSIVENDFAVPEGKDYHNLLPELESNLGSPDTDIRENSLEIIWAWITKRLLFTNEEIINLGNRMAANLHIALGEKETDSVFLRSFSALILGGVIYIDRMFCEGKHENRTPFLSYDLLKKWLDLAVVFFIDEKDWRGYIPIKKWAHAVAHGSDLLKHLSLHPLMTKSEHIKILEVIAQKLTQRTEYIFTAHEEARMLTVIAAIQIRNLLSLQDYDLWLLQIVKPFTERPWYDEKPDPSIFNNRLNAWVNVRLFLDRFYYLLVFDTQQISEENKIIYKNISQYKDSLIDLLVQRLKQIRGFDIYNKIK